MFSRSVEIVVLNALVIDDVPVQNILRKMLLESGVDEVKTASTGSEGLRYLSQGEIDLLILDIHLPDMSGLDVLKQVRESGSKLFVVVATGYEELETVHEIIRMGANRYIVKPVQLSELKQVVEQVSR
mgnify:FL=1